MSKTQRAYTGTIYGLVGEVDLGNGLSTTFYIEILAGNEQAAQETVEILVSWPLLSLEIKSARPWADPELN